MGFLQTVETDAEGAFKAAVAAIEPKIKGLGATLAGQLGTAASVFLQNPTLLSLQEGVASIMGSLAADAQIAEADVAAGVLAFAAAIQADLAGTSPAATPAQPAA